MLLQGASHCCCCCCWLGSAVPLPSWHSRLCCPLLPPPAALDLLPFNADGAQLPGPVQKLFHLPHSLRQPAPAGGVRQLPRCGLLVLAGRPLGCAGWASRDDMPGSWPASLPDPSSNWACPLPCPPGPRPAPADEVQRQGGKVLVHCMSGMSRSPAVVIFHLMRRNSWRLRWAVAGAGAWLGGGVWVGAGTCRALPCLLRCYELSQPPILPA